MFSGLIRPKISIIFLQTQILKDHSYLCLERKMIASHAPTLLSSNISCREVEIN